MGLDAIRDALRRKTHLRVLSNPFALTCYKQTRDGYLSYSLGVSEDKNVLLAVMQSDVKRYGTCMVLDLAEEATDGTMDFHYYISEPGHGIYLEYRIERTPFFPSGGAPDAYRQALKLIEQERAKLDSPCCDWCGKPAQQRSWRTFYEGMPAGHTSAYHECLTCAVMSTADLLKHYEAPLPF